MNFSTWAIAYAEETLSIIGGFSADARIGFETARAFLSLCLDAHPDTWDF